MGKKASWTFMRRTKRNLSPLPTAFAWGTEQGPALTWLWLSSPPVPTAAATALENMKGSSTLCKNVFPGESSKCH